MNYDLNKLKSITSQLNVLKENIRIRVLNLGMNHLVTMLPKHGICLTVCKLAEHLK